MQYEYLIIQASVKLEETESRLNKLGGEGWELVAVSAAGSGSTDILYLCRATSQQS